VGGMVSRYALVHEMSIHRGHKAVGQRASTMQLPPGVSLLLIGRAGRFSLPEEVSVVMAGDLLLFGSDSREALRSALATWDDGLDAVPTLPFPTTP